MTFAVAAMCAGTLFAAPEIDVSPDRVKTPLAVDMERIGTLRPRSTHEIEASNWTIDAMCVDRDFADFDKYAPYLERLGIKKLRLQCGWYKSEKTKGAYDVAWLDHIVDESLRMGVEPIMELSYGNPLYEGGGGAGVAGGMPNKPEGLAAWDRWVGFLAAHFKDRIREWAMWNEPDCTWGRKISPEEIAAFNIRSARILREAMPKARLHALSLAFSRPSFLEKCIKALGEDAKLFDTFIYHGYAENPDFSYTNVEKMKDVVRRLAPHAVLRQGENGCPSEYLSRFGLAHVPWTEYSQAKWDMRRMLGDLGHDVESSVFGIVDIQYRPPTYPVEFANRKGLLRTNESNDVVRIKRAYYAVQNVASVFDCDVVRVKKPAVSRKDPDIALYEYKMRDGSPLFVFWNRGPVDWDPKKRKSSVREDARPGDGFATRPCVLEYAGRALREPVWVDLLTGRAYRFPAENQIEHSCGVTFVDVPFYDSPCFIAERTALRLDPAPSFITPRTCAARK